jgi:ABC-type microcin C transport system permease subunit YejE
MNWKNVAHLIRVDMKSGRLIRGRKLRRYRESKLFSYLLYGGSMVIGLAVGVIAGFIYRGVAAVADPQLMTLFHQGLLSLFLALPTLVLIYSLVFTMMQQIQRGGVKFSIQPPYWLPITWRNTH